MLQAMLGRAGLKAACGNKFAARGVGLDLRQRMTRPMRLAKLSGMTKTPRVLLIAFAILVAYLRSGLALANSANPGAMRGAA